MMIQCILNHPLCNMREVTINNNTPWRCSSIPASIRLNMLLDILQPKLIIHIGTRRRCKCRLIRNSPLSIISLLVCFPLPHNQLWNNNSTSTDSLQYTAEFTRPLSQCSTPTPHTYNCYSPLIILPHGYALLITVPNLVLSNMLPPHKVGQLPRDIHLQLSIICCCLSGSLLTANMYLLEAWIALEEPVHQICTTNIDMGVGSRIAGWGAAGQWGAGWGGYCTLPLQSQGLPASRTYISTPLTSLESSTPITNTRCNLL